MIDTYLLASADGLVGSFANNMDRLAYSLMATRGGIDCLRPYVSLDVPWCFGLSCRKEGDERLKVAWRRSGKGSRRRRKDMGSNGTTVEPAALSAASRRPPPPPPPRPQGRAPDPWRNHALSVQLARRVLARQQMAATGTRVAAHTLARESTSDS